MFISSFKSSYATAVLFLFLFLQLLPTLKSRAQEKADKHVNLDSVVVTSTRSERNVADVPMRVTVISRKQIEQSGLIRLDQILFEQTGVQLANNHGTGPVIQGLSADYIMIMIDGEPLIGRTNGTLDLSRINTNNIERIEIIKGPSSSLYGSEAMGGVINIITRKAGKGSGLALDGQYGSFNTINLGVNASKRWEKASVQLDANRLSADGYSLNPASLVPSVPPRKDYTFGSKSEWFLSPAFKAALSLRYFTRNQQDVREAKQNGKVLMIDSDRDTREVNVFPVIYYQLSNQHKFQLRNYYTQFRYEDVMVYRDSGADFEKSFYRQTLNRTELIYDATLGTKHFLTAGAGRLVETMEAKSYEDLKPFLSWYGFIQDQWTPLTAFNVVAGLRYDKHSEYASQFTPKVSAGYKLNSWITMDFTLGTGFKAPDFRQLYIIHHNPTAGYSVLGTGIAKTELKKMQDNGEIAEVLIDPARIGSVKAESSVSYQAGAKIKFYDPLRITLGLFRNDISNLMETSYIAKKTNGRFVSSYFNLAKVVTTGFEATASWMISPAFQLEAGYMYLSARDKGVLSKLEKGDIIRKSESGGPDIKVSRSEYGGLFGRAAHTSNLKLAYNNKRHKLDAYIRGIYNSRFGVADLNKNGILDIAKEYAKPYLTCNLNIGKTVLNQVNLYSGVNNLFNSTQKDVPFIPVRSLCFGLRYNMNSKT
ncbi:TonB-dependent receptor [Pedobacter sp. KBW06]|uniref:TonB-dependent receptor plug domain-containing protein n=1 Tax=Pedobacter sp. KBW06 TaxID=2153359 RepID=UPI000F5AACD0|nr:TonB-dependent receptor [Pedobacter sp. KBW06]RQO74448.1 TonB-dependent receptor [Pedobacter sp. KBW06]